MAAPLPTRSKKKVGVGIVSRMKTTIAVKNPVQEKALDAAADHILDLSQSFTKEVFPFHRFFATDLTEMTVELDKMLQTARCQCDSTTALDHFFRLRHDGASKVSSTEDLPPPAYLNQVNRQRRDLIAGGSYNEQAFKVVKRYGNVLAHLLDVHLENLTIDSQQELWNHALILMHFRKTLYPNPSKWQKTDAVKVLAMSMAVLNQVRGENGLKPLRNYINPVLVTKSV